MKVQDNFSEMHLFFSEPVTFKGFHDTRKDLVLAEFTINLPTVRDLYFKQNVGLFLGLIKKTVLELKKGYENIITCNSHLEFLNAILTLSETVTQLKPICTQIIQGLQYLCPSIAFEEQRLVIQKQIVEDELFERMKHIWLVAIGAENYSEAIKYMTPEQRMLEEKVRAIKNSGKNRSDAKSFEKIYIILTYEFGYSREEILEMTMYMVKTILKYTGKSINYKLTLLAKAYGNTKKVKFIANEGDK